MLKSSDFLRQTQSQCRHPMLQNTGQEEQLRKLNDYKQEEQNLNRLANTNKNDQPQIDPLNMRVNMAPFYRNNDPENLEEEGNNQSNEGEGEQ